MNSGFPSSRIFSHKAHSRFPGAGNRRPHHPRCKGRRLRVEPLEPRRLLAVIAEMDEYWIDEDETLYVGSVEAVSLGDEWEFFDDVLRDGDGYPDGNQPADWNDPDYDTADPEYGQWETGNALFAYGQINTVETATPLDGPAETHTTYLFRTTFTLDTEAAQASEGTINYVFDDGAVVYVNGLEVLRVNMEEGVVNAETFTSGNGVEDSYTQTSISLDGAALVEGENALAVEVHQVTTTSSDAGMDMALRITTSGSVLDNDTTTYFDKEMTASVRTQPTNGVLSFNTDGTFTYTPNAEFSGVDSFMYWAQDRQNIRAAATVTITINGIDDPPVAVDDAYVVLEDGRLVVDTTATQDPDVLIERGATWSYQDGIKNEYFTGGPYDYPTDVAGRAWNDSDFDVNTSADRTRTPAMNLPWELGEALLAVGRIDGGTTVTELDGLDDGLEGRNSVTTYLFRKTFQVDDPNTIIRLEADILMDDGGILYINGQEALQIGEYEAPLGTTSFISSQNSEMYQSYTLDVAPLLVPGENVLAVEVHQTSSNSSDVGLDLELTAVSETTTTSVGLLDNDFDEDGDPVTSIDLVPRSGPVSGTLVTSPAMDGSFTYTPDPDFWGYDSFWYTITAGGKTSEPAMVNIDVSGRPDPPVGVADEYWVEYDDVLRADSSFYQDPLGQGTVLLARGSDWYFSDDGSDQDTLNPAWKAGPDTPFDPATAAGWYADPAPATFGFDVTGNTGMATELQPGPLTYYFRTAFDVEDPTQIAQLLVQLMRDDGAAVYINGVEVARQNLAAGADYLQLAPQRPLDEHGYYPTLADLNALPGGNPLRAGENVVAVEVHQAKLDSTDLWFNLELAVPEGPFGVLANDLDPDPLLLESLTASLDVPPPRGNLSFNSDGTFTYVPEAGFSGPVSFRYAASDGTYFSEPTPVTINVLPSNTAPETTNDRYAADEDVTLAVPAAEGVLSNDTDVEGESLSAVLVRSAVHGELTFNADGSFTYVPEPNFFGTDTFVYRADDGLDLSESAIVSIDVAGSDDPPAAVDDAYRTNRDTPLVVDLPSLTDPMHTFSETFDGDELPATLEDPAGAFTVADGVIKPHAVRQYARTVATDFITGDFVYEIDLNMTEETGTVDFVGLGAGVRLSPYNEPGQSIHLRIHSPALNGDVALTIGGSFDGFGIGRLTSYGIHRVRIAKSGNSLTFAIDENYDGRFLADVEYTVDDLAAMAPFLNDTNSRLFFGGSTFVPFDNMAVDFALDTDEPIGVLANDVEPDRQPMTAVLAGDVARGTLALSPDGTFVYTPEAGFTGTDAFTYTAADGTSESNTATVTITVNAPPVATDDAYVVDEDATLAVGTVEGLFDNDVDAEGDPFTAVLIEAPLRGTLALAGDGSFTYQPDPDFFGTDTFTYLVDDGTARSDPATVTITVAPVDDVPVAVDDQFSVDEDNTLAIDGPAAGVLANDVEQDGDALSVVLVSDVQYGQLALAADGTFTYEPAENFSGLDTFTYRVSDGIGESDPATVTILVRPVNDAPVATNDQYAVDEDQVLVVNAGISAETTAATFAGLVETQVLATTADVRQLEFSPRFNLLFVRDGDDRVRVIDTLSGNEVSVMEAVEPMTDMDLTPAGDFLFVSGYGGTRTGYGTPVRPHWVHRFDLATRTWETKQAPKIAYRLEAVDAERVLLHEQDQSVSTTLNHFGATPDDPIVELARRGVGYRGDIEYDHRTGRIYHGNSGLSSQEIAVIQVVGDTLVSVQNTGTYGTAQGYGGTSVLSTGGDYFYYGRLQTEAADVRNNLNVMPETIWAASGDIAFGNGAFYNALSTAPLGDLGYDSRVYAAGDDGLSVWAYQETGGAGVLHQYRVPIYGDGVLANDTDTDGDGLSAVLVGPPTNGTLAFDAFGGFTYTPEWGFSGIDTFTYRASDGAEQSNLATVSIQVNHVGPVTADDAFALDEDGSLDVPADVGVLANDVDSMGHAMTAMLVDPPEVGQFDLQPDGGFQFTPPPDFFGQAGFTYVVSDGAVQSAPTAVTITVRPVNDPPVAVDDQFIMNKGTTLQLGQAEPAREPFAGTSFTEPATGDRSFISTGGELGFDFQVADTPAGDTGTTADDQFRVHGNDWTDPGTITFDAVDLTGYGNIEFSIGARSWEDSDGSDFEDDDFLRIIVRLADAGGATAEIVVLDRFGESLKALDNGQQGDFSTFTAGIPSGYVSAVPIVEMRVTSFTERVFIDDVQFTGISNDAVAGVLLNDVDVDGDVLTAVLVDPPALGTLALDGNGSFAYTPPTLFVGTDTFTYRADDGTARSNLATVTIEVMEANVIPRADDDSFTTAEDVPLAVAGFQGVLANDVDFDGGRLTAELVTGAANGTITLAGDGSIYYVPEENFSGTDTFTYRADDGRDPSNVATVTITVDPVNDPPIAVDDVFHIAQDETLEGTPGGLGSDAYMDVILQDGPIGYWRLGESNTSQQAVDLAGGHNGTYVGGVTPGQPGALFDDDDTAADFDGSTGYVDVGTSNHFRLNAGFTIEAWIKPEQVNSRQRIVGRALQAGGYAFTVLEGRLGFTVFRYDDYYTPPNTIEANRWSHVAAVLNDTDDMSFYVDGALVNTVNGRFPVPSGIATLLIGSVDAILPSGQNQNFNGLIDEVAIYDRELTAAEIADHFDAGMPQPAGESVTLVPAGSDWRYLDDGSDQQTAWREVSFPAEATWQSGPAPLGYGDSWIETEVDYGPNGNSKYITTYFRRTFNVENAEDVVAATLGLMRDDGAAVYLNGTEVARDNLSAGAGYNDFAVGNAVEYTYFPFVIDPSLLVDGANVLAAEVHQASPTSSDVSFDLWLDATLREEPEMPGVLLNDFDPEGGTLSAQLATQPLHGTIDFPGDGSFTYTPDAGFIGTDRFVYRAIDEQGADDLAAVTVNVGGSNQSPVGADDYYFARAGRTLTIPAADGVMANDIDPNGDALSVSRMIDPEHGTLSLGADGSFTYEPEDGFVGIDRFRYRLSDGTPFIGSAWTTIEVHRRLDPMNGLPIAEDDAFSTPAGTVLNVDAAAGLLANDVDPEQWPLTAVLVDPPRLGTVGLAGDGSFTYTPIAGAAGTDTFTYRVSDGNTFSPSATVTIDVANPPGGQMTVLQPAAVLDRHVYYRGSAFDTLDAPAIATDKTALLPGEPATSSNFTNYAMGINGIVIDVAPGDTFGGLSIGDFELRVGNGNDPSRWVPGPEPMGLTTLAGAGTDLSDRVLVALPNGTALGAWLQVTIRASVQNGLFEDDVFYLGNVPGETGNSGIPRVNAADVIAIRDNPRGLLNPASIDNPRDINRDRAVDAVDLLLARDFATSPLGALRLITAPPAGDSRPEPGEGTPTAAVENLSIDAPVAAAVPSRLTVRNAAPIIFGNLGRKAGADRLQWRATAEDAGTAEPIVDALAKLLAGRGTSQ